MGRVVWSKKYVGFILGTVYNSYASELYSISYIR